MITLLEGIQTFFQADATLAALDGPWLDVAPDKKTYPYCVMIDSGGPISACFDLRILQQRSVTFRIYHTDYATLRTYQAAMHDRFDRGDFALTAGLLRSATRTNDFRGFAGRDKDNKTIFVATSVYRFTVQGSF
ncbi:MAG: hypothetical protein E6Q97_07150 [Desulfurellales bacterium]|nr:MAG: hypothetical protein E6Q97_07150 [Desulfurellales bacterium]